MAKNDSFPPSQHITANPQSTTNLLPKNNNLLPMKTTQDNNQIPFSLFVERMSKSVSVLANADHRKELDVSNVREELGDLLFYIQGMANLIGSTLPELIAANMDKLRLRYAANHYSDLQAVSRADKAPSVTGSQEVEDFIESEKIIPQCRIDDETCESCQ